MRFLLLTLLWVPLNLFSQDAHLARYCGFDYVNKKCNEEHPGYLNYLNNLAKQGSQLAKTKQLTDSVYRIPVVFHVVWNTPSQNLSNEVVERQIEILNENYRRLNANAADTREQFLPVVGDPKIEFYLATEDPDGNATDGILHVETEREEFVLDVFTQEVELDEIKFSETGGSNAWDTDRYLNIWSGNISLGMFGDIFGIAYPPAGLPNWPDGLGETPETSGVIVKYTVVGDNNPAADEDGFEGNDLGITAVHEVGHYLGLRHVWGDAIFEDGCTVDDGFSDTPNQSANSNFVCLADANSCDEGENDLPDMWENYMDYSDESCQSSFTAEQIGTMVLVLEDYRPELWTMALDVEQVPEQKAILQVFPNPSAGFVTVTLPSSLRSDLQLIDLSGSIALQKTIEGGDNRIDLARVAPGVYFLQVSSRSGQFWSQKLIVQ